MKCKFCGNEVAEDAVTCSACGAKLKAQVKMAATQNVVSTVKESQETENFVNTTTEKTEAENFVSSSGNKSVKKDFNVAGVIPILTGIFISILIITEQILCFFL